MKKSFIKKVEKKVGLKGLKNKIKTINLLFVFLVLAAILAVYLNHTGYMISYGLAVAAVSLLVLAFFLSYRIKLQVQLAGVHLDYRELIVKPVAEYMFNAGTFSRNGSATEREILNTKLFSDTINFRYSSINEVKGDYNGVKFFSTDIYKQDYKAHLNMYGRLFQFDIPTENINPVVFTTKNAPLIEYTDTPMKRMDSVSPIVNSVCQMYTFDENEARELVNDKHIADAIKKLMDMRPGMITACSFYNKKINVFYSTEGYTFEEDLNKKHDVPAELKKSKESFMMIGRLIDMFKAEN